MRKERENVKLKVGLSLKDIGKKHVQMTNKNINERNMSIKGYAMGFYR